MIISIIWGLAATTSYSWRLVPAMTMILPLWQSEWSSWSLYISWSLYCPYKFSAIIVWSWWLLWYNPGSSIKWENHTFKKSTLQSSSSSLSSSSLCHHVMIIVMIIFVMIMIMRMIVRLSIQGNPTVYRGRVRCDRWHRSQVKCLLLQACW